MYTLKKRQENLEFQQGLKAEVSVKLLKLNNIIGVEKIAI